MSATSGPQLSVALAVLALAATLRVLGFDLMEFKYDEVAMLELTREWLGRGIPVYGMMSGVGVRNPPGFVFLLLPWVAAGVAPPAVGLFVAALNVGAVVLMLRLGRALGRPTAGVWAAGLMAAHPWLVLYSRKIWAQSTLPLFVTLALVLMADSHARPRSRTVFWLLPVTVLAWQIHFSAWCLAVVVAAWLAWGLARRLVSARWALGGAIPALLLLAPYGCHLAAGGFADVRAQAAVGADTAERWAATAGQVAVVWGQSAWAGGFGQVAAAGPAPLTCAVAAPWGGVLEGVAWVGTAAVILLAAIGARVGQAGKAPSQESVRPGPERFCGWLVLAVLLPPALYALRGIPATPHYFVIGLPALLMLAGIGLERATCLGMLRWVPAACGVAVWLGVLAQLRVAGGTGGDYGVAYRHQRAAAETLARAGVTAANADLRLMRDNGAGVVHLLGRLPSRELPAGAGPANEVAVVVDTLRHPQHRETPFAAGWRESRAGPLRIGMGPAPTAVKAPSRAADGQGDT